MLWFCKVLNIWINKSSVSSLLHLLIVFNPRTYLQESRNFVSISGLFLAFLPQKWWMNECYCPLEVPAPNGIISNVPGNMRWKKNFPSWQTRRFNVFSRTKKLPIALSIKLMDNINSLQSKLNELSTLPEHIASLHKHHKALPVASIKTRYCKCLLEIILLNMSRGNMTLAASSS